MTFAEAGGGRGGSGRTLGGKRERGKRSLGIWALLVGFVLVGGRVNGLMCLRMLGAAGGGPTAGHTDAGFTCSPPAQLPEPPSSVMTGAQAEVEGRRGGGPALRLLWSVLCVGPNGPGNT